MMYRLISYPFNIAVALLLGLLLSLLNLSYFYKEPTSDDITQIALVILVYLIAGLFINRRRPALLWSKSLSLLYKPYLFIGVIGFCIEFYLYGAPMFLSTGREDYSGIPVMHVVFYSCSIMAVLFSALYSSKRALALSVITSFVLAALLLSRQMMMISFVVVIISIVTRYKINKKLVFKTFLAAAVVIVLFGLAGNVRQQIAGDYVDDYIIEVGGANNDGVAIGQTLYWIWLYIASPVYNLMLNLTDYDRFGESCNAAVAFGSCRGDYLLSVIIPNTISKYLGADEFFIDMVMAHLNAGTAFSAAARILGLPGVILQAVLQILFFMFGHAITGEKLRPAFVVYFSTLSVFMIFDNLFIKGEFFFVFVLIVLSGLYLSKKPG